MQSLCNYLNQVARGNSRQWYIIIDAYGGKNSYEASLNASDASYAFRDKLWLFEFYDRVSGGSYPSNGFSFLDSWVDGVTKGLKDDQFGYYINYQDGRLNRTYAQKMYWRQSLPRLQKIKGVYDPKDIFYYPHGVEPVTSV
jgi:hypothetical protein